MLPDTRTPILQFGTSRLLQAHADLFLSEALARGRGLGRITIVQSSGDAGRSRRLAALAGPEGFPVRIRGLEAGQTIDRTVQVTSVSRTLSTAADWPEICRIGAEEAEIILSNTADAGYAPNAADAGATFDQAMSFPAKLSHLLQHRYRTTRRSVQIMPVELISNNGQVLRDRVLDVARDHGFRQWLQTRVCWVNSLVDRIVSEPIEPAGAIAEPYALWAVEDQPGLILPCTHPAIRVYSSLEEPASLKLFLLNLAHTVLADDCLADGGPEGRFVRHVMTDPVARAGLEQLYREELLPGFAAAGMGEAATAYIETTLERFANPFLDHKISDIAQNHAEKIQRRCHGFLDWATGKGDMGAKPRLSALAAKVAR
jgi:tagaturonate reductase